MSMANSAAARPMPYPFDFSSCSGGEEEEAKVICSMRSLVMSGAVICRAAKSPQLGDRSTLGDV